MATVPGIDEMQNLLKRLKAVFSRGAEALFLLLMTLKSLTVIQRGNFVLPEQSQGGRSQGNRKNGSGKKKKKK